MKITLTENPLNIKVELDDSEKLLFRAKLEIKDLEDTLFRVDLYLDENRQFFNLEKARKALSFTKLTDEQLAVRSKCLDENAQHFIDELLLNHVGDCTCVAASCSKCHAESLLGIDTLGKIGKHELNYVDSAFRVEGIETCEQAIQYLESNPPTVKEDWHKDHIERWTKEQLRAIEYLKKYSERLRASNVQ